MTQINWPSETYLLVFGAGAEGYSWWKSIKGNDVTKQPPFQNGKSADYTGWSIDVTLEDGEGGTVTKTIDHQVLMDTAKTIAKPGSRPQYIPESIVDSIWELHNRMPDVDLDANAADILVQVAVLRQVVFG